MDISNFQFSIKHHVIAHELASEAPCHINTIFWGDRVKHKLVRSQFRMQCLSKAIYSQFCPHYARELQGSTKWCQICWSSMLEKSWKGKYETLFSTHQVSTTFALITADKSTKSQVFPLTWRKLFQFHPDWWLETPNGARSLTPHAWLPSWWKRGSFFYQEPLPSVLLALNDHWGWQRGVELKLVGLRKCFGLTSFASVDTKVDWTERLWIWWADSSICDNDLRNHIAFASTYLTFTFR